MDERLVRGAGRGTRSLIKGIRRRSGLTAGKVAKGTRRRTVTDGSVYAVNTADFGA